VINKLKLKSKFSLNIMTLMLGTTVAQAIPIIISPILTRIYSPEEFGLLILFMSIVSILSVIVSLRYERAIIQPLDDEDAISLVVISMLVTIGVSTILTILINIFYTQIQELIGNNEIGILKYWVPFAVLITGFYNSLYEWHVRKKQFALSAKIVMSKGAVTAGGQVGLGTMMFPGGLIFGYLMGIVIAFFLLMKSFIKSKDFLILIFNKKKLLKNVKKYKKMPQYSTWGALADNISLQMPTLVIATLKHVSSVGIFGLTIRVLSLPANLLSQALSSVLFQKVAELHYDDPDKIKILIIKIFLILNFIMIPFIGFIWFFGENLFAFIFGEPWREAGVMASILVFAVAIRFVVSPLSVVLLLDHNIKLGTLWQFIYFITITVTLYIVSSWPLNDFLIAFVIHEIILYFLYFIFILKGSNYSGKI
jgi:O-antigen/teichoic acid export membrane protein